MSFEPSDKMVEAAARALYLEWGKGKFDWSATPIAMRGTACSNGIQPRTRELREID